MRFMQMLLAGVVFAACGNTADTPEPSATVADAIARIEEISVHVTTWSDAADLLTATTSAEAAANLVVGPNGPGYGDRNGDGQISGANDVGLLPGSDGTPQGLVLGGVGDADCIRRDVLGGAWDDPAAMWREMDEAIAAWTPTNNTMPSLDSHPMRVVGWATFTQTATLDQAREYAGHAAIHVNVSSRALRACSTTDEPG